MTDGFIRLALSLQVGKPLRVGSSLAREFIRYAFARLNTGAKLSATPPNNSPSQTRMPVIARSNLNIPGLAPVAGCCPPACQVPTEGKPYHCSLETTDRSEGKITSSQFAPGRNKERFTRGPTPLQFCAANFCVRLGRNIFAVGSLLEARRRCPPLRGWESFKKDISSFRLSAEQDRDATKKILAVCLGPHLRNNWDAVLSRLARPRPYRGTCPRQTLTGCLRKGCLPAFPGTSRIKGRAVW